MTDVPDSTARDPLEVLVEQFLAEHRRGAVADVETFAATHPEHASQLRELLPTLVALEQVRRDRASSTGGGKTMLSLPAFERLGDFRIVREVGRGGMGVVFEAVQESLERHVALKVLPRVSLLTGNQLQRFQREARTAAQLHHSNIVPVFGSGESDGFHWYAMQFIAGQSLDAWRHEHAGLPPGDATAWRDRARFVARIGAQAASALQHAHEQGTLHRDIKPGNLLLGPDDHVWVTDFGLAKALEAEGLTHSSDLLGTLQYMAPEQFAGEYDVRSEVYALGVTLYELLVLRPAFAGRTRSELMEQIRTLQPAPLRRACPLVPADLAVVVERAMARDPRDRYADAAALQQDLQAFLDDRPIAARRHNAAQLLWRWCRRNRTIAALAASTLVAVVAAGVTGWVAWSVTDDALVRVRASADVAAQQTRLVESNLQLTLTAFGELFDALVGRDPALAVDEDPDTGEQSIVARTVVDPRSVGLMQQMLSFYDRFAAANAGSQSLRFETARAHRRVGAIQARLGNLDAAAASYLQSLARFTEVVDRDCRREQAAVHVDLGQVELRRGNPQEAVQRFRLALDLLGADRADEPRSLRFERAQAHFLLARRPGPGQGPGQGPGRPLGERFQKEAQHELESAQAILTDLLQAEPQNPEFRALQARCLLEAGHVRGADRTRSPERERSRDAAVAILRQLVAEYPAADQYAYELCEALWPDARRLLFADAQRSDQELARLREARMHADRLVALQPDVADYRLLRGNIAAALGRFLLHAARAGGAARDALLGEAEAELRTALATQRAPTVGRSAMRQGIVDALTRAALAEVLADTGRGPESIREIETVVAGMRDLPGAGRRLGADPRPLDQVEALARRLGRADLATELRDLRDRLAPPDEPQRPR